MRTSSSLLILFRFFVLFVRRFVCSLCSLSEKKERIKYQISNHESHSKKNEKCGNSKPFFLFCFVMFYFVHGRITSLCCPYFFSATCSSFFLILLQHNIIVIVSLFKKYIYIINCKNKKNKNSFLL